MREHDWEPLRGLPAQLPPGEKILWQGTPRWTVLTRRIFPLGGIIIYFAALILWRLIAEWNVQPSPVIALKGAAWLVLLGVVALGALIFLGWVISRATVYTITNQRVIIRMGVAISMIVNLPFKQIHAANLKLYRDGTGDLPLLLNKAMRLSYLVFWPHVRPWRFSPPEPMLRSIPDAAQVAAILAAALRDFNLIEPSTEIQS